MHELSIAQSLLDTVRAHAGDHPGARVTKVGIRVGELSGVEPEALLFSFDVIVRETEFRDAVLDIERVPLRQHCEACGRDASVVQFTLVCPDCGASTRAVAGDELQMSYLELA